MKNKLYIGLKIKSKRLVLNLRMEDVAKEVGATRSTLWSIENGSGNYSIDTLLKILDFLDMEIDIRGQSEHNRKRATRLNTILDKKINRFIIMCVEQYAAYINSSSQDVYCKLEKEGIIDEIKSDYEDMHGMSTYCINEYIDKRLSGGAS